MRPDNVYDSSLRTAVGIFAIISSSCKGCGGSEGTPACSERDKYAKDARGLLFTGNDQFLMKSDMSCEGCVSAYVAGACLLHPCFLQGLWSASSENMDSGGAPLFIDATPLPTGEEAGA